MVHRPIDEQENADEETAAWTGDAELHLPGFLPYRLSRLTNRISRSIARIYSERFDLTIPEWRVLAILAEYPGISASEVAERAAMDKVAVSRAVTRLRRGGRVTRKFEPDDRRRSSLDLTVDGRAVHARIVPLAKAYEAAILGQLNADERAMLDSLLHRLDALNLEELPELAPGLREGGANDGT